MALADKKILNPIRYHQDNSNIILNQASAMKSLFDQGAEDVRVKLNGVIDELLATTGAQQIGIDPAKGLGNTLADALTNIKNYMNLGASGISATTIGTGSGNTVQSQLEWLLLQIQNVVLGQILDGTVTMDKLSTPLADLVNGHTKQLAQNVQQLDVASIANSLYPLYIPTYDNANQPVHPKVLAFGTAWNGFKYWMAYTPYTGGNDLYENPSIAVSNDLVRWQVPTGFTNPLQTVPNPNNGYHYSDTHLVYRTDLNRLEIWYRYNKNGVEEKIYRQITTDGITWTENELVLDYGTGAIEACYSPAIIHENGKYRMWYIGLDLKLYHMESVDGLTWTNKTSRDITFDMATTHHAWHIDVEKTDLGYEMLVCAFPAGNTEKRVLFYTKSTDGLVWDEAKIIIKPSQNLLSWDNAQIYRSSLIKINGVYYVFYSAVSNDDKWNTGLAHGTNILHLKGYDNVFGTGNIDLKYLTNIHRALLQKPYLWDAILQTDLNAAAKYINNAYGIKGRVDREFYVGAQGSNQLRFNYGANGDAYFYNGTLAKFKLGADGDLELYDKTKGIIISSADNTRWRIQANNNGTITTTNLTTSVAYTLPKFDVASAKTNSIATTVNDLKNDLNDLLARLRSAGIMAQ